MPTGTVRLMRAWLAFPVCATVIAMALLAGCSSREIYDASSGWRRNECNKIGEQEKRERCLKEEAGRSYDDYRAGAASQPSR